MGNERVIVCIMGNQFEAFSLSRGGREDATTGSHGVEKESWEGKKEIIENARRSRSQLLKEIFTSRTADMVGNLIPGVDVVKLNIEAVVGKTISGEELSAKQRFTYTVIAGGITLAYALEFAGMRNEAITVRGLTATMAGIEFGPAFLKLAAEKAQDKYPKIAHILGKISKIVVKKEGLAERINAKLKKSFSWQPA